MSKIEPAHTDWYRLLKYQRAMGKTGLTIPFLVGASFPAEQSSAANVNQAFARFAELFLSLRDDTPDKDVVVISECTSLREPIAAVYAAGNTHDCCDGVVRKSGKTLLLVHRDYFESKERTVNSAVNRLWRMLGEHVVNSRFSFRGGSYAPFDAEDRAFLEKARAARRTDPQEWSRWKTKPL